MRSFIAFCLIISVFSGCSRETARDKMFDELRVQRDIQTPFPAPGVTYASFDSGHGYQIEYLDPNGNAYLWYPGNNKTVVGNWKTLLDEMCYRYGSDTFNPQTLQRGGSWNCEYAQTLGFRVTAYQAGDVFNLKSGNIPYARGKCDLPDRLNQVKKVSCS